MSKKTKFSDPSPSGVCWPKEWSQNENWASREKGWASEDGLKSDPRKYETVARRLTQVGLRASALIEELGGPTGHNLDRTIEQCHERILSYYRETGKRLTSRTSEEDNRWDVWLRNHKDSSLFLECNKLGLPGGPNFERTLEQCHRYIRDCFERTGKRPVRKGSGESSRWDFWLRNHKDSSLSIECSKLGLHDPDLRVMEDCHRYIRDYFKRMGKRPATNRDSEARRWDRWLRKQGSSLSLECNKLRLPELSLTRTLEEVRNEVLTYYKETGKRPHKGLDQNWYRLHDWLRRQGSTLAQECDNLGLPGVIPERTLEDCHRYIWDYFERTGKRPIKDYSKEANQWDAWLRSHKGSSLSKECNDSGIPGGRNLNRTLDQCHRYIRAFHQKTGGRPGGSKEDRLWDAWLRNSMRSSSLTEECDKLGILKDQKLEQCHRYLRKYFKKTGEKPTDMASKEAGLWGCWLQSRGSSLFLECKKLGL